MPFFGEPRKFVPGDLVYGIEADHRGKGRKQYVDRVNGPFSLQKGESKYDNPRRIDHYRVLATEKMVRPDQPQSEDEKSFLEALEKHPKYKSAIDAPKLNEPLRHKDKGGLYWATMLQQKYVHFILDGLDLAAVVNKSFTGKNGDSPPGAQHKNRSITGSELRWVYRHREVPAVQERIQFWFNLQPCPPPWSTEEGSKLWATYKPRSTHVHDPKLDEMADEVAMSPRSQGKKEKTGCNCSIQ